VRLSQNTRLVIVVACFAGLIWLSEYQVTNRAEFAVGVLTGLVATVLTLTVVSILDI
jgi:hypothetical protein